MFDSMWIITVLSVENNGLANKWPLEIFYLQTNERISNSHRLTQKQLDFIYKQIEFHLLIASKASNLLQSVCDFSIMIA